jgi:hypothetical protein
MGTGTGRRQERQRQTAGELQTREVLGRKNVATTHGTRPSREQELRRRGENSSGLDAELTGNEAQVR